MTTTTISLKPWRVRWAGAALALAALAGVGTAQAHGDVVWSVGVQSPGISMGLANTQPVIVAATPSYYAPPPGYYAPRPVYVVPSHRGRYDKRHHKHYYKHHHKHHKHHKHHRHDRHDRHDRYDRD